jgi:hypothetical protein
VGPWSTRVWACVDQLFRQAEQAGFDEAAVRRLLTEDPFATDAEYTGLISYTHALDTALQPLPAGRALTVVLETCLAQSQARPMGAAYAKGLLRARGEVAVIAGCEVGQSSYAGVFDNRWHGAFTWALTTLLSQWDVVVTNAGRSFERDYTHLLTQAGALMRAVGFTEQVPTMWSEPATLGCRVFGRLEWDEQIDTVEVLRRVKVREEIDAGTDGHIFQITDANGAKGFLVVTKDQISANGYTWNASTEYWAWSYSQSGLPSSSFALKRPPTAPSQGTDLAAWITANDVRQTTNTRSSSSVTFPTASARNGASFSNCHRARRSWDSPGQYLAVLRTSNGSVTWSRISGSAANGGRLLLLPPAAVAPDVGDQIDFEWISGTIQVDLVDGDVVDF